MFMQLRTLVAEKWNATNDLDFSREARKIAFFGAKRQQISYFCMVLMLNTWFVGSTTTIFVSLQTIRKHRLVQLYYFQIFKFYQWLFKGDYRYPRFPRDRLGWYCYRSKSWSRLRSQIFSPLNQVFSFSATLAKTQFSVIYQGSQKNVVWPQKKSKNRGPAIKKWVSLSLLALKNTSEGLVQKKYRVESAGSDNPP